MLEIDQIIEKIAQLVKYKIGNNYSMVIEDDVIRKSVENLVQLYLKHDEDGLA